MKKLLYLISLVVILFFTASCGELEVIRTKLTYEEEILEIMVGDEINITPLCNKEDVIIKYEASCDIVSIDESGNLKAIESGTVVVTATTDKRSSVSAKLIIIINDLDTFTITFDVNGGDALENNMVTYQKKDVVVLPIPTKLGYKFLGWYENDNLVNSLTTGNHSLTAMWEKLDVYTIEYDLAGGNFNEEVIYEFTINTVVTLPKPSKVGCIFLGWYEDGTEVTKIDNKNYQLVAKWYEIDTDVPLYTIVYNANGGVLPTNTTFSFSDSEDVTLPIPTKSGYDFKGWYENDNLVTKLTNKNYSLLAKWEAYPKYNINYDLDGGILDNIKISYTKDEVFILEEPVKEGYTFKGWTSSFNSEPIKQMEIKNQTGDLSFKAIYEANTYKITLKSVYTSDTIIDVVYNESIKLSVDKNIINGMKLLGWNTEYDLSGTTYLVNQEIVYQTPVDIVLYAVWTSLINLDLDTNEKLTEDLPIIVKGQKEFILPIPKTTEFVFFAGWYIGEQQLTDEMGKNLHAWEFEEEVTITPKWVDSVIINNYTYYYLGEYPQTRVIDQNLIAILEQEKTNYLGYCEYDGEYYGKVVYNSTDIAYFNDGTKVIKGNTYYFKVEPILWRELDKKKNIVISEYVLDCMPFYDSDLDRIKYDVRLDLDVKIYPNDFLESSINRYLNDELVQRYDLEDKLQRINYENEGFKRKSFGGSKKLTDYIEINIIDNSEASTLVSDNLYSTLDSTGYFYPLSHKEYKNTYASVLGNGIAYATDYAIAKGVENQKTATSTPKGASYWLRSPYHQSSKEALYVRMNGKVSNTLVTNEKIGLRPVCKKMK